MQEMRGQRYLTSKFFKDHVRIEGEHEKKQAENKFLGRDVSVSTMLYMSYAELNQLGYEVMSRQDQFRRDKSGGGNHEYKTLHQYRSFERGGDQGSAKKRARQCQPAFLEYDVRWDNADSMFKIHHMHGMSHEGGIQA